VFRFNIEFDAMMPYDSLSGTTILLHHIILPRAIQTTYSTLGITHGCLFPEIIPGKKDWTHKCVKKTLQNRLVLPWVPLCRFPTIYRTFYQHRSKSGDDIILFTTTESRTINWTTSIIREHSMLVQTVYNIENAPLLVYWNPPRPLFP